MANPKGNPQNLRPPWPKGVSGNPAGGPKRRPFSDRYAIMAEQPLPDDLRRKLHLDKGATWGDAVSYRLFVAAFKGQPTAARELREAVEGRAAQRIELTGAGGKPLNPADKGRQMASYTPEQLAAIVNLSAKLDAQEGGAGAGKPK